MRGRQKNKREINDTEEREKKVKERKKTDRNKERKRGKEKKQITMEEIKRNGGTEKYKSGKKMI